MFLHLRCAVLEKGGKLPLSLLSLLKGSLTAFPLWKLCTVKKGQNKTLQGQSVCSELPPVCHFTQQDTAPSPLCRPHLSSSAIKAWGTGNAQPRAGFGLQPGYKWEFSLSQNAKLRLCFGEPGKRLGRVWQCLCAWRHHEECVGHTGTALLLRTSWKRKENWTKHNSLKSGLGRLRLTGDQLPPECSS